MQVLLQDFNDIMTGEDESDDSGIDMGDDFLNEDDDLGADDSGDDIDLDADDSGDDDFGLGLEE